DRSGACGRGQFGNDRCAALADRLGQRTRSFPTLGHRTRGLRRLVPGGLFPVEAERAQQFRAHRHAARLSLVFAGRVRPDAGPRRRRRTMNMIFKKFPTAALIDGEWVTSPKTFAVADPASGAEIARVPDLGVKEAVRAVDAASRAFPEWSAKTAKERAAILKRWFDLMTAETESLAQLMTAEQGKP